MKLLSLRGSNVGLLKGAFEYSFDDALTVITGPIGSGKSTILTMIRASLLNNFPGGAATWASWGVNPQEACYFVAKWQIGEHTLEIAKCVQGDKNFAALNIPRLQVSKGDTVLHTIHSYREAAEMLQDYLSVPSDIIDGHLIVDQDGITAPVSMTPAKFKETFQALTRDKLDILRGQMRDALGAITVPDLGTSLEDAEQDMNVCAGQVGALDAKHKELLGQYQKYDIQAINARMETLELVKANNERQQKLKELLSGNAETLRLLQERILVQEGALVRLREQEQALKPTADEASQKLLTIDRLIADYARHQELTQRIQNLTAEVEEHLKQTPVEPPHPLPTQAEEEEWKKESSAATYKVQHLKERLRLAGLGQCPQCGSDTSVTAEDMTALRDRLCSAEELVLELGKVELLFQLTKQEWQDYEYSKQKHEALKDKFALRASTIQEELTNLGELDPAGIPDKQSLLKTVDEFQKVGRGIQEAEKNSASMQGQHQTIETMQQSVKVELEAIPPAQFDANEYVRLETEHSTSLSLLNELSKLEGETKGLQTALKQATTRFEAIKQRAASVKPIENLRKVLDKACVILHKDNLPRLLSLKYVQKLNERLSFYLKMVNAEFAAYIDENLEFMAKKTSGLVHHARRLSGGQKQQASVCYLLAVNDVFASSLGILALDEPSGAMQESNSQDLAEAFCYLAKISKTTDRQFIVITHSQALAAHGCTQISLDS